MINLSLLMVGLCALSSHPIYSSYVLLGAIHGRGHTSDPSSELSARMPGRRSCKGALMVAFHYDTAGEDARTCRPPGASGCSMLTGTRSSVSEPLQGLCWRKCALQEPGSRDTLDPAGGNLFLLHAPSGFARDYI